MALLLNVPAILRPLTGIIAFLRVDPKSIVLIRSATLSAAIQVALPLRQVVSGVALPQRLAPTCYSSRVV